MPREFQRLPSLRGAQALEALDRLGSAALAADELGLTRSAVSHTLRRLEAELGFPLTEPEGRGLRLTPRAARYAAAARRAMRLMADAAAEAPALSGDLTLVCPPAFGAFWLSDRLGAFADLHPELRLTVLAPRSLGRIGDDRADVEIAFADPATAPPGAALLTRVRLSPVCAPSLLSADPGLRRAADLERLRLLHLTAPTDWERWLDAAGVGDRVDARAGVTFSDMPMAQLAAAAGQGVALGDDLTAAGHLASGQLVRPFPLSIPSRWSYFIDIRDGGPSGAAAAALGAWLRQQVAASRKNPEAAKAINRRRRQRGCLMVAPASLHKAVRQSG